MIANVWLRPGSAHTANNAIGFLQSSIEHLGAGKRVGLLRADSGFSENAFLQHLEQSQTAYTVAMRLNQPLQHALVGACWWPLQAHEQGDKAGQCNDEAAGIELCEIH